MDRGNAEVETGTKQARTGIEGLDDALYGGLPRGRTTLIVGTPGSGKTQLALQFLVNGIVQFGEPGLMISFEEAPATLAAGAAALGLPPDSPRNDHFHIIDGRPTMDAESGGAFDISGLVAIVAAEIRRLGIRRLAFDGLDALFSIGGRSEVTAREFRRLVDVTDSAGVTALICLKPSTGDDDLPRHFDLIEYTADAVIRLGYRLTEGLLRRILRIVKVRNAGFAAGELPFIISDRGFEISYSPALKRRSVISNERVSTGIVQLDQMLEGGLLRSSVTLISGLPGTAKSTIGASFLRAALARGERCLLIALDEPAEQLISNVRSVGIDIAASGPPELLKVLSLNPGAVIADEHYLRIERLVRDHAPTTLVIDPISAFEKSGGRDVARLVVERLTSLVKTRGIAAVYTAIANSQFREIENTSGHVSSIADTWIHLSFAVKDGERNRTLTIVKSRGTGHSNQLRELLLSNEGVTLQAIYQVHGGFLLGTARLEREQEVKRELQARQLIEKNILRELAEQKAMAQAKLRDAEREIDDINERMSAGVAASASFEADALLDRNEVSVQRGTTDS